MAISTRIKRLFHADVNAILDVIEEPDAILKQAIREMQENLDWKRGRLARNEKNLETLKANKLHLSEQIAEVEEDLKLCLKEGSEELARKTIARKLSFEKHSKVVARRISNLTKRCEQQTCEVEAQQSQLESIVEKAEFYVRTADEDSAFSVAESILSSTDPGAGSSYRGAGRLQVTEEEVELEWIRLRDGANKGGKS
ncbi:MAG TPA: PspA/IM30 family protein [Acidobacteriota bacterium]|nr:PspA/IM30 family protein [Acidobacteriota bacterium]